MNESKILFAKVKEGAIIPSKEEENAGFNVYVCCDGEIKSDKIIIISPTFFGIIIKLKYKYIFLSKIKNKKFF